MSKIVLATRNKGKLAELSALLADSGIEVESLAAHPDIGEIPETGDTFEANARIKAEAVCKATGLVAVADDSGLMVDALEGAPGIYSARFSGEDATDAANNVKLLKEMACVPDERRTARFVCVMVAMAPDGEAITARGTWEGVILREPRGEGGFGYDPLFFLPGEGVTSAELPAERKNDLSHRGQAMRALMSKWPDFWKKACKGYPLD
jgi:XTP/dITP diphosphohydrolase